MLYEIFPIFEIMVVCIEVFTVYFFQKNWFVQKHRARWQVILAYLAFGVLTGAFSIYYPSFIILPLITYVGIVGVSIYRYQGQFLSHLFASILLLMVGMASEFIVAAVVSAVMQVDLTEIQENGIERIVTMFSSKMLCLLFVGLTAGVVGRHKSYKDHRMLRTIPLLFSQLILTVLMGSIFLGAYYRYGAIDVFGIIEIGGILFVSIFIFTYYDTLANAYEHKHREQMAQTQIDNLSKHYTEMQEEHKTLISLEHDIRKFLNVVDGLISEGHKEEAIEFKKSLEKSVEKHIGHISVPHPVVNTLLSSFIRKINNLDANARYEVSIPKELAVADIDLTVILGNVFDNAVEALESIESADGREVVMTFMQKENLLLIELMNTYNPQAIRTKNNDSRRGYGLNNVRQCVQKYSGDFITKSEDCKFLATVIIDTSAIDRA